MEGRIVRHLLRKRTALALCAIAVALTAATSAAPGNANAALLCGGSAGKPVFLPWLDALSYTLSPGGSFESGTPGWSLAGGASVANGNESFYLTSTTDKRSLNLPAGASATSPTFCISATQLDLRLLAKGSGTIRVDILGKSLLGLNLLQSQKVTVGSKWAPSPILLFTNGLQSLLSGGTGNIAIRVTTLSGSAQIDDVYIDPFKVN
jgi:hypothetical protein